MQEEDIRMCGCSFIICNQCAGNIIGNNDLKYNCPQCKMDIKYEIYV